MTEQRLGENSRSDTKAWRRVRRFGGYRVILVCWILTVLAEASGWEEGDDAVNVISVENMDALLGLRMVTELKSFEGFKPNETESRTKRMVDYRQKTFPISSQVTALCTRTNCRCDNVGDRYLNITCDFQSQGGVELGPGSIPPNTYKLQIYNAQELRVLPGTFSEHINLVFVNFHKIGNLSICSSAFQNLSEVSFILEIKDCKVVTLEEHSFRNFLSPIRAKLENCETVKLKKSIFSWLLAFQIINVPNLELVENTFSVEASKLNPESTETMILFQNVSVNEIPNATFPLSAAKIRFVDCGIATVCTGAFNAIVLVSVYFEKTKLGRVQKGAFSERTLIQNMEFTGVEVQYVESNALSAAAKFTIQDCRIEEVTSGAFDVNTAYLKLLGNYFKKIRRYAFKIQNWNSIIIEGNHFDYLEPEFFSSPFTNIMRVRNEFSFSNNTLLGVEIDVLSFIPHEAGLDAFVQNNIFEEICHCHLETWLRERSSIKWELLFETSFCFISPLLKKCYNITQRYMNMKEYTEEYCTPENMIVCEDERRAYRPNILVPIDLQNTERTVLGVIFLGVVCSIAIMLLILSLMWVKEKGLCGAARKTVPSDSKIFSFCSRFFNSRNLVTSNSISQINIHEYAEIQFRLNQSQKQTILAVEDDISDEDETVYENKATQTLPEELTQELIQSLREKLYDPDNHNEARDMIEHLYDLIKVEESCNNNYTTPRTSLLLEDEEETEGMYEVIKTKKLFGHKIPKKQKGVAVISIGTRAPSPDKLSPINFNIRRPLPTIVSDYIEPQDRKSNEYCEVLATNVIMPDVLPSTQLKEDFPKTHIYAEPLPNRSLPKKTEEPGTSDSDIHSKVQ